MYPDTSLVQERRNSSAIAMEYRFYALTDRYVMTNVRRYGINLTYVERQTYI